MVTKARPAVASDANAVLTMALAMRNEAPSYKDRTFDAGKVLALFHALIEGKTPGGVVVADKDGEPIGMLAFVIYPDFFGPQLQSCDLALYVTPHCRGSSAFGRLVAAYRSWARQMGADRVQIGVGTGLNTDTVAGQICRLGFSKSAVILKCEAQHV